MSLGDEEAKEFLYFLVLAFDLAVALGMIGGGEVGLDSKALEKGAHDLRSELRASITDEPEWETMETEYFTVVDVCNAFGGDVGCTGESMKNLAVVIGEDDDRVVSMGFR